MRFFDRLSDRLDVIFGLLALVAIFAALVSGEVPHDISLWLEALAGLVGALVVAVRVWNWIRRK